jgi:hypothetical protein
MMHILSKSSLLLLVLGSLFWAGCQSEKASETDTQKVIDESLTGNIIDCKGLGKLKFSMSYAEVESIFGKENISNELVPAGTEDMMEGTISTEDQHNSTIRTDEGTIYINWKPAKVPVQISAVSFEPASPAQALRLPEGLKVGDSLADFIKANGEAVDFYGFGWQFGGMVISKKGKILEAYPCLTFAFGTADGTYEDVSDFMGDGTIRSNAPGLALERIVISQISYASQMLQE